MLWDSEPPPEGAFARIRRRLRDPRDLLRYLIFTTETHAHCAALAFFALLAFYPLSALLLSLSKHALGWTGAHGVVVQALREYYPDAQAFLLRNLEASVARHGRTMHGGSAAWILLSAAGVFIPLETAFNRLWGAPEQRPYWRNQAVGFLLTAACSAIGVALLLANAGLRSLLNTLTTSEAVAATMRHGALRVSALAFAVCALFLFYRFLPNCRVRGAAVWPAALVAGVAAEAVRELYQLALPLVALAKSQGPFYVSVSFVLLVYVESFVLLAGAYLAVDDEAAAPRHDGDPPRGEPASADPPAAGADPPSYSNRQ